MSRVVELLDSVTESAIYKFDLQDAMAILLYEKVLNVYLYGGHVIECMRGKMDAHRVEEKFS